eukprot:6189018-Pleurochrysis_carterae.AAC.1
MLLTQMITELAFEVVVSAVQKPTLRMQGSVMKLLALSLPISPERGNNAGTKQLFAGECGNKARIRQRAQS